MGAPVELPEDQRLPPDAPLVDRVVEALRTVYDPEIPVNIYELGLVYRCDVDADGDVEIDMTLTAPGCPVAGEMPGTVQAAVLSVPGVRSAKVELVWEPGWHQGMMSDEARIALNMF
ncbi:MAG TPA: SUF system Fe-S cluster assembly protein [Azospirillaceae bacterium]|nr:SUF system Fe-S cluster assembly protein [Azospirillaceae bacterium]